MPTERQKFYLYVDETGQQTRGELFIVALALIQGQEIDRLQEALLEIEVSSRKDLRKWVRSPIPSREAYLALPVICRSSSMQFYYILDDQGGTDYIQKVARSVGAVLRQLKLQKESRITIVIDGFNLAERQTAGRILRDYAFPYRREIRGGRDESNPFLRLADAMAGFIRHAHADEPYAKPHWQRLRPFLTRLKLDEG